MAERERDGKTIARTLNVVNGLSLAGVPVTATAAQINSGANAVGAVAFDRLAKIAKVPLVASDAAAGLFTWANPEAVAIIVDEVILDITTASTGACSVSVGTAATAVLSANLLDTQSIAAIARLDNFSNKGAGGSSTGKVAVGQFVTGSKASGATLGVVGFAYINYFLV